MKLKKVDELAGGEILARPIMTPDYKVLLSEEVKLRPEYIEKIRELGITEIYVKEEELAHAQEVVLLKSDLETSFRNKVKTILEKHTYHNNSQLVELISTADHIIENILEEDEVVEQVFDIKERSADIYEHSISTCSLATLLALRMQLSQKQVHDIGVGSLLHDLGLRYLTVHYENQDLNSLSGLELAEYKKHPIYGYSALKNENWISEAAREIILYHHERKDGSGYPLHAKDIPLGAQIVSVCDAFDEMICSIGCEGVKVYEAVEYLKTFRDIQFEHEIVDLFLDFTAVYPVGSKVLLSNGQTGTVIRQNKEFPDRPVLQLQYSTNQIDLIKVNHVFIEKVLE